jgi:hypothetical protein
MHNCNGIELCSSVKADGIRWFRCCVCVHAGFFQPITIRCCVCVHAGFFQPICFYYKRVWKVVIWPARLFMVPPWVGSPSLSIVSQNSEQTTNQQRQVSGGLFLFDPSWRVQSSAIPVAPIFMLRDLCKLAAAGFGGKILHASFTGLVSWMHACKRDDRGARTAGETRRASSSAAPNFGMLR